MKPHSFLKLAAVCLILLAFLPLEGQPNAAGLAAPEWSPAAEPPAGFEIEASPAITTTTYLPIITRNYPYGAGGWITIMTEDFESSFPTAAWEVYDQYAPDGLEFFWAKKDCRPYPGGSFSGWAIGGGANGSGLPCGSVYPSNADAWMVYGPFSLKNSTAADFKFKEWHATANSSDILCIGASPNGATHYQVCRSGNSNGWADFTLNLASIPGFGSMLNRTTVWVSIQFVSYSTGTKPPEGAYVDNIVLRRCPTGATCAAQAESALEGTPAVRTLPSR